MDLSITEGVIKSWVETLSGLPFEWGANHHRRHNQAFVLASPGLFVPLGRDEERWLFTPSPDGQALTMSGIRHLTITLSFRSFDQRLNLSSRKYAEEFRILTTSPSSIETLAAAELGLVETSDLGDTDYIYQRRQISQADMDVTFAMRFETDDPIWGGEYINVVADPVGTIDPPC